MACTQISPYIVRFAPSPSGRMHAGNIASALIAWLYAHLSNGEVVLRIDDLDQNRSKPQFIFQLFKDFENLGLTWDRGPFYESRSEKLYHRAYETISQKQRVYPCFCSRADIAASRAPHKSDYRVYRGTCRNLSHKDIEQLCIKKEPAYRLFVPQASIAFYDLLQGKREFRLEQECGDIIIKRADGSFSYQLAVCVDDASEGINLVTRGCDLLASTPVQIYIHKLLGNNVPQYAHIPLLISQDGRRLSKRNKDASLEEMLFTYKSPEMILGHIAYLYGIIDCDEGISAEDLISTLTLPQLTAALFGKQKIVWKP